jgi:hypothetical protein
MTAASEDRGSRGQILVLTGLLLAILLGFAALLVDGGYGLHVRRTLQNASDAAALAGANVIQAMNPKGCSSTSGGTPYPAVRDAALASVATNLPDYDLADVEVTCPTGQSNIAVSVELRADVPTFFGRILGGGDWQAAANATARFGRDDGGRFNIILLNPGGPAGNGFPQARNGCPSLQLNGGVSLTMEGSIFVDSECLEVNGGAFATKGGSASLTMTGEGSAFRMRGEYRRQSLTIDPPPLEHQRPLNPRDPLASFVVGMDTMALGLPVQKSSKWVINGTTEVLYPGKYVGGIELRSSAIAYLTPGIYVMEGGGFQVGAQAAVISVPYHAPGSTPTTTAATWPTDCLRSNCGVLIYKTNTAPRGSEQVAVTAGATMLMRAFNPDAVSSYTFGPAWESLRHFLFWQDRLPEPSATYAQPSMILTGGGQISMSGTIYAPSALIDMRGTSGGGGGGPIDLTLQFVAWDLEFGGNVSFVFRYSSDTFVLPLSYGLIE